MDALVIGPAHLRLDTHTCLVTSQTALMLRIIQIAVAESGFYVGLSPDSITPTSLSEEVSGKSAWWNLGFTASTDRRTRRIVSVLVVTMTPSRRTVPCCICARCCRSRRSTGNCGR